MYGSVREELAKTFQDGAHTNDFFDLGKNDLGKKLTLKFCRKYSSNDRGETKEVCNGGVACSLSQMAADKPRPLLQNSLHESSWI